MTRTRAPREPGPKDVARFRSYYEDELQAAALYRGLADHAGERADLFERLARTEESHAAHWQDLLAEVGVDDLRPPRPSARTRALLWLARRLGIDAVLPFVIRIEARDADKYRRVPEAGSTMAEQETAHGMILAGVAGVDPGGDRIVASEGQHRTNAGGALRAGVFGVNDGLVSNFSLVMGIAGGTGDPAIILLAGVAGLFAGAFSMATGEWISVQSQKELYEREIEIEREELEHFPDEERRELELLFQVKGMGEQQAMAVAEQLMANPETALDTLAREELGLDPDDLASPWVAAFSSFFAFAAGALVPVVPYLLATGTAALIASAVLAAVALFVVGGALGVFTGRSLLKSGLRMAVIGGLAAGATFLTGTLFGVALT